MWFVWSAFAEACVRLNIPAEFRLFSTRAILCGLLNDGVFGGRFRVQVFEYCQQVSATDSPGELRRRYAESVSNAETTEN
jgi:hypothetical protein